LPHRCRSLYRAGIRRLAPLVGEDLSSVGFCPSAVARERRLPAPRPIPDGPCIRSIRTDCGKRLRRTCCLILCAPFELVTIAVWSQLSIADHLALNTLVDTTPLGRTYSPTPCGKGCYQQKSAWDRRLQRRRSCGFFTHGKVFRHGGFKPRVSPRHAEQTLQSALRTSCHTRSLLASERLLIPFAQLQRNSPASYTLGRGGSRVGPKGNPVATPLLDTVNAEQGSALPQAELAPYTPRTREHLPVLIYFVQWHRSERLIARNGS